MRTDTILEKKVTLNKGKSNWVSYRKLISLWPPLPQFLVMQYCPMGPPKSSSPQVAQRPYIQLGNNCQVVNESRGTQAFLDN